MPDQRHTRTPDDIRGLIERVDGELRRAELLRSHANERIRRGQFWPERRKTPRIPQSPPDANEGTSDQP